MTTPNALSAQTSMPTVSIPVGALPVSSIPTTTASTNGVDSRSVTPLALTSPTTELGVIASSVANATLSPTPKAVPPTALVLPSSSVPLSTATTTTQLSIQQSALQAATSLAVSPSSAQAVVPCKNCGQATHRTAQCFTFKTRLCEYWSDKRVKASGECRFSDEKCMYAHGEEQLRSRDRIANNKTSPHPNEPSPSSHNNAHTVDVTVGGDSVHVTTIRPPPLSDTKSTKKLTNTTVTHTQFAQALIQTAAANTAAQFVKPYSEAKIQCHFISVGTCENARRGDVCPYRHGFCGTYSQGKECRMPPGKVCPYIHHTHSIARVNTFQQILECKQLKDPDCVTCRKNPKWNFSPYCLNCSQDRQNKKEFCPNQSCNEYMWARNACFYCRPPKSKDNKD